MKRYAVVRDGHFWAVMDIQEQKLVECPLPYIKTYVRKRDAKLTAKWLNTAKGK